MSDTDTGVHRGQQNGPGGQSPTAWVRAHRLEAGAGAAAAVVAVALFRRQVSKSSTAGDAAAAAAAPAVAGLNSPDTTTSDIENWVQDALNQQNAQLSAQLAASLPPAGPSTPTPAPKPGQGLNGYYKTVPGGTTYHVHDNGRWRVTSVTLKKLQKAHTVIHTMDHDTMAKIPYRGIE